jgi:hypothetical protein
VWGGIKVSRLILSQARQRPADQEDGCDLDRSHEMADVKTFHWNSPKMDEAVHKAYTGFSRQ